MIGFADVGKTNQIKQMGMGYHQGTGFVSFDKFVKLWYNC